MMGNEAGKGRSGSAGRRGEEVRSDLWVHVEGRDGGGIEVSLVSKVAPYYGEAIAAQTHAVLTSLGVEHARVEVEDQGALPFAIAARLEAAVRRAGLAGAAADPLPERLAPLPPPSARDRLRRSRLYLPGNEPRYFPGAVLHRPDAVILDLEDSVHPAEKDAARILVRNALRTIDFGSAERMVRINQLPLGLEDLERVVPELPDVILIPKVERPDEVRAVGNRVAELLEEAGEDRPLWLMPILESALGIENAFAIASSSPRVAALTIGLEDYTADLGVVKTAAGEETLYARQRLVNAARAAAVQPIDSVWGNIGDADGLAAWAERSRAMGFAGMGCVHPLQVATIHRAFAPSGAEIDRALAIVAAFEDATARGLGVVSLGSKMIDPPVVTRALKLVQQARAMGLIGEERS
jgi:citrate lyase subunit beta / citryl-CoA lyase